MSGAVTTRRALPLLAILLVGCPWDKDPQTSILGSEVTLRFTNQFVALHDGTTNIPYAVTFTVDNKSVRVEPGATASIEYDLDVNERRTITASVDGGVGSINRTCEVFNNSGSKSLDVVLDTRTMEQLTCSGGWDNFVNVFGGTSARNYFMLVDLWGEFATAVCVEFRINAEATGSTLCENNPPPENAPDRTSDKHLRRLVAMQDGATYDFKIIRNGTLFSKSCVADLDPRYTVRLGWTDALPFPTNPGLVLRCLEGFVGATGS